MKVYGSDVVIDLLAAAGVRHVSFNPGASIRGLQDSLSRSKTVQPILALHENVAVGMAHGYYKSAGVPMAVFLHDLVGLQNAQLAVFNAFMDSVPILVIGGSGPRDWSARRPWIDWVHSAQPQASFVRDVVKWDAEPVGAASLAPVFERAWRMALTPPMGPVYVAVDVLLQEQEVTRTPTTASVPPPSMTAEPAIIEQIARQLQMAEFPVIIVDRPGRGTMAPLVEVADSLGAAVIDLGSRLSFPTTHPLNVSSARAEMLERADHVLLLEPRDVVWSLSAVRQGSRVVERLVGDDAVITAVGLTELQHRGLVDRQAPVGPVTYIDSDVGAMLRQLLTHLESSSTGSHEARVDHIARRHREIREEAMATAQSQGSHTPVHPAFLAHSLGAVLSRHGSWQLANGLLSGWPSRLWEMTDESDYLGRSGGEGLGYGLPASVGAALAQAATGRLVVNIQGDGDFMYAPQALWTAARYRLPLLTVVHDNGGYERDRAHQREIAAERGQEYSGGRSGVDLGDPDIDFLALAAAQGVEPIGTTSDPSEVEDLLQRAVDVVGGEGRPALVAVRTSE